MENSFNVKILLGKFSILKGWAIEEETKSKPLSSAESIPKF